MVHLVEFDIKCYLIEYERILDFSKRSITPRMHVTQQILLQAMESKKSIKKYIYTRCKKFFLMSLKIKYLKKDRSLWSAINLSYGCVKLITRYYVRSTVAP